MKSIRKYFQRQLLFAIMLGVVIYSLLLGAYLLLQDYSTLLMNSRIIFGGLNTIYTSGTLDDAIIELITKYIPENKFAELKAQQNRTGLEAEGRRVSALLQEMRNQHLQRVVILIEFENLFIFILLFIIVFLFSNTYRFVKKSLVFTQNTLLYFNQALFNRHTLKEIRNDSIPYQEMQEFGNFFTNTMDMIEIIQELQSMDLSFSIEAFIDRFGSVFCSDKYQNLIPCDRFSLALYNNNQNTLVAFHATVRGNRPVFLNKGFTQSLHDTSLKTIVDRRLPYRIINNLQEKNSLSAQLLLKEGISSNLTIPIIVNQRLLGFIFFAHSQPNMYTDDMGNVALLVASILNSRIFYSYALQTSLALFGDGIVNIVEFKDDETADHTRRVSLYASLIAEVLQGQGKITPQKTEEIRFFAPLHDLGKIAIPDSILLKPGKLTDEEWAIMKQHPVIGGKLLKNANDQFINQLGFGMLHTAYNIVMDHHEWWNGTGYPQGKQGMDISLEGQIVAIADVFDALTTKRPYKEAFPIDQALHMLQLQAGTHFNPELIDIFIEKRPHIVQIYQNYYVLG
ncbi:HD domain-containing phosphohydrolase [Gracilinema caldarium]|uniref:Metal dependent phosphohydrolase n=1 Tax=Gracilinema caldarium (strain ATCC 51460 / DSM 7334 / H1) TaxID=744872 RepID=F8EY49_GRAC1|nr:HD domain-containing phosphohydrolase [Gracilinema caldarium]AEJ20710.1 metal dependent phosphohydrolase [Gracilinema caldarium DSM 7334]